MSASYNRKDMDQQREEEFLLYIAAGTDPLTALAALPRDRQADPTPTAAKLTTERDLDLLSWIVLIVFAAFSAWLVAL
ncbi:MAG: hypothetical protein AB7G28_02440 [Pirellulales bacterium]